MKKFLCLLGVLILSFFAGPAFAGNPPATATIIHTAQGTVTISEAPWIMVPGEFYSFDCPSYADHCELMFGNGGNTATEVVWFTDEKTVGASAEYIEIEPAATLARRIESGTSKYFSIHTYPVSIGYPQDSRVDFVGQQIVVGSVVTSSIRQAPMRAIPAER